MTSPTKHYCLITDITADTTLEELANLDAFFPEVVPGTITYYDQPVFDAPETFYARLEDHTYAPGALKTGATNQELALSVFEKAAEATDPSTTLVFLCTSPYISKGTYEHTLAAAEEFQRLHPNRQLIHINTMCTAGGLALFCDYLNRWALKNSSKIKPYAYFLGKHVNHLFTEGSLDYPRESGRWNGQPLKQLGTQLLSGLNIVPKMYFPARFDDASENPNLGNLQTVGVTHGWQRLLRFWVQTYFEQRSKNPFFWDVRIGYTGKATRKFAADLAQLLEKRGLSQKRITMGYTTPFVGVHTGPDQLSFFFVSENERPDH